MIRSLHIKLVLVLILLIVALMTVVGAFLINGVNRFYIQDFTSQMADAFGNELFYADLLAAAEDNDAPARLKGVLDAYSGLLGIESNQREFFITNGQTGRYLTGSNEELGASYQPTPNVLTALATNSPANTVTMTAPQMDVAVPIGQDGNRFVVEIRDNKLRLQRLTMQLFTIITEAILFGLIISVLLSFLLSKTMTTPIERLTRRARKIAEGDFSEKLEVPSGDELGVLTRTFNSMAGALQETLEKQKHLDTMRREFVANVSHELRTPLTNIKSYAEVLAEPVAPDAETVKHFSEVIVGQTDRMSRIVQDLLTLSRMDYESATWHMDWFSLSDALGETVQAMLLDARKHRLEITLEMEPDLPDVWGDRERMEQVLVNILGNAVKYTPDGGRIAVTAEKKQEGLVVAVADSGQGIPAEDLPRLFERFYRVDKARSRASGGTGLGLSIAREIIERHRGRIDIESEQGKGTTVTVVLPLGRPEDEQ